MGLLYEQILRVIASALVGAFIGYEREIKNKPAGFFTFTLVCMGSCLIAILQENLTKTSGGEPARIIAQVVSGVGFLGAGTILHNRGNVVGISTAAMLWLAAGLGLLIGTGGYNNYIIAFTTVVIILPVTMITRRLSNKLTKTRKIQRLRIVFEDNFEKDLFDSLASFGVTVKKYVLLNKYFQGDIHVKELILYFSLPKTKNLDEILNYLSDVDYIHEIEQL
ncbi:MAG TPA: MgtC/SapB family protein [Acholeplasmataceae bacterium]|jgi:putative Mg2+ transporter-C (MgtC) family protein|nr:MgtC/SapB family protein [Acholeplasmataceae bacterium]